MNTFTLFFLIALTLSFGIEFWLAKRQAAYVAAHRNAVPEAFRASVALDAHQKAADYTLAKSKLGDIDRIVPRARDDLARRQVQPARRRADRPACDAEAVI